MPALNSCLCMQLWVASGVEGVHRFLRRAHRLVSGAFVSTQPAAWELPSLSKLGWSSARTVPLC